MSNNELRPYYDPSLFDAGYSVTYRPGLGVLYPDGKSIVDTIFNNDSLKSASELLKFKNGTSRTLIRAARGSAARHLAGGNMGQSFWHSVNSSLEILTHFLKKLARNYFKVILNQPFDIVRVLLQIGVFDVLSLSNIGSGKLEGKSVKEKKSKKKRSEYDEQGDSADYFFSNNSTYKSKSIGQNDEEGEDVEDDVEEYEVLVVDVKHIQPLSLHTIDVMSSILSKEGTTSLWKATNVSYIYQALSATLESWLTGFFAPFLEIPDPFYIDINYSPDPFKSFVLILVASITTGIILAPLDLIRTKLIITNIPATAQERYEAESRWPGLKRSLRDNIKMLKFYFCPIQLLFPTILNSTANKFIKNFVPYLMVTRHEIGSGGVSIHPIYDLSLRFLSEFIDLIVKLPVETLLRRAQTSYLVSKSTNDKFRDSNGLEINESDMIVKFVGYKGYWSSLVSSVYTDSKNDNSGLESLFRGWKIGALNIFARWGFKVINSDSKFVEEKF